MRDKNTGALSSDINIRKKPSTDIRSGKKGQCTSFFDYRTIPRRVDMKNGKDASAIINRPGPMLLAVPW